MRKLFKKVSILTVAAVLAAGTLSLASCSGGATVAPDTSANAESVVSNGGFVVGTGEYYYFINGVEAHTASNKYGDVVKGALMRVKKSDLAEKKNTAETVIPSLFASSDYSSGFYIYGEGENARVYYATPTNVKNTSGQIESDYLDFKSAKLDGSDIKDHFRASDNATVFRFVEVEKTVYCLYVENNNLHSFNTAAGEDTELVTGMSAYVLNSTDKSDPYVYYTMAVKGRIDSDNAQTMDYNQIYRVRADATEAAHPITFDKEWVDEKNDGKEPYRNFGSIVLDGLGSTSQSFDTRFSPHYTEGMGNLPAIGYQYTLQSYNNDGIYFTRSIAGKSSEGLFYLAASELDAALWNSITGNEKRSTGSSGYLEVVASAENASKAGTAAIFYIEENASDNTKHHYLYAQNNSIYRADVVNDGAGNNVKYGAAGDLEIAYNSSSATLVMRDAQSDDVYDYVYYTRSSGSGNSVERVAYNGTVENYTNLSFGTGADANANAAFKSATVAGVEHASSWYQYEIIDNTLFYANAQSVASASFNYTYTVNLKNENGKLMNAEELKDVSDKYDWMMGEEGFRAKVTKDYSKLSGAINYYFYTGESAQFQKNIDDAVALGKKPTYLYKEDEQKIFNDFVAGEDNDFVPELNGDGKIYRTQSAFITFIGQKNEADTESWNDYWVTALENYTETEEDEGLAWWAWLLIGLGIAAVVAAATVTAVVLVRKQKKGGAVVREKKIEVDTTDDRDIDVYEQNEPDENEAIEEPVDETIVEETSEEVVPEESVAEEPVEEPAEEPAAEETAPAKEEPKNE